MKGLGAWANDFIRETILYFGKDIENFRLSLIYMIFKKFECKKPNKAVVFTQVSYNISLSCTFVLFSKP